MVGREMEMQELHWCRPRPACPPRGSHCDVTVLQGTYPETHPKTCKPYLFQIIYIHLQGSKFI
jgi:hypothetical protein